MKPHEAAESYQFVTFQSENISLSMVQTFPPKSDQIINSGIFHFDDYTAISVNPVMTFQESSVCSESGYVIPTKVEFRWNGKTIEDDQDYEVTLNVEIDERFTKKVDVLAEVPYLLRKVIQMLVAKPYVYQTMQEVEVTCRIGDRVMQEKGRIFFEFAFITGRGPIP
ncbi:oxidative stress survival, Svf1-like protein, partial [Paraphysoderma sedebokerense]